MCYVTATELKQNLAHYLELATKEDVYVTKNKKVLVVISPAKKKAFEEFFELEGCLSDYDTGESYDDMIGSEVMDKCVR